MEDISINGLYEYLINYFDNVNCAFFQKYQYYNGKYSKYILSNIEEEELNKIKESKYDLIILINSYIINIKKGKNYNDKEYISLEFKRYSKLSKEKSNISSRGEAYKTTILIYEDFSIIGINKSGCYYPLQLSTISKKSHYDPIINNCIISILEYFSKKHLLFKDLCNEYKENGNILVPIDINLVWNYNTKYDLLTNRYKNINLPKSINKYSLQQGYLFSKLQKYIDTNHYNTFLNWFKNFDLSKLNECVTVKEKINNIFECFYFDKFGDEDDYDDFLVYDYIMMLIKLKQKINFKIKSYNRLKEEHDKLAIKFRLKSSKKLKIPKNSKFNKLKLSPDFKRITTTKKLIEESIVQKNCVSSYLDTINKDNCAIYSLMLNEKRYTVEIRKKYKKFYLAQMKGFTNEEPNQQDYDYVKEMIKANN